MKFDFWKENIPQGLKADSISAIDMSGLKP
jgi:hypothetical protein